MRPDQLDLLTTLSSPTLHPSGERAVVAVTRPDLASNSYVGQLWEVPVTGDGPRRLTRGFRDTAPQYSPDGTMIGFLRATDAKAKPQLHVVAATGGEPVRLTDAPLGAGGFAWAPDGHRIAYTARVPEPGRYGTDPEIGDGEEAPRLITDLRYLGDGVGYVGDRRQQVFVVDVSELDAAPGPGDDVPESRQLSDAAADSVEVVWRPDGQRLALVSARHETRTTDLVVDAWTCASDGTDLQRVTDGALTVEKVAWSPDGATLWLLASDPGPSGLDFVGRHTGLWSVPADGSGRPTRHTDAETIDLGEIGTRLTVTADGVHVQRRTRGAVELLRIGADGEPTVVVGGPRIVTAHDVVGTGADAVVVATTLDAVTPGELVAVTSGEERVLTDFGAPLREGPGVRPLHERTVTADDGYPVHGWVVLPDGPGPHPVLLDIHGGPFAQYGWQVYDEAQVLAAAGYAVLLANPRGSAGYGQEHGRSIIGALGRRDADDLLDFLDGVLADPELALDSSRMGVLGGSYGGYMTAWLTAHPRAAGRFAAAVVERGFLDPVSFAGTSDIGWFFGDQLVGTDPEQLAAQSPMAALDRVETPTLVIHSERDFRCPLEQGQRWFHGLQKRGVPSELLIFPGESHGLTREGQPRHRRQRFDHLLRWWATHLPTEANRAE
ncbi:dipeptidyl aminopeptidase/acylaminoacyl peptidase [Friedmanniella endophytica]|uniref:Dipeptidyl aminopeptidase/acylaminoacyl peptidase n=1 Tax=Microlunatus kandeliicorticis TaxID=1759536 RepID=A0A7W3IPN0_9ACTN|nr:S9 family peptidase [Microlunatus kandeliicorticis]MBA8792936.1 dipeptidyl aminopeptidase/acylaminoacyl peptidase [Microlunatus kandeliicorticis]